MTDFPRFFDEKRIAAEIDPKKVLRYLKVAFEGLNTGSSVQPSEVVTELQDQGGDCVFYTGLVAELGAFGVAASPYLNARERNGLSPVTSYTLLLSTENGLPLLFCDSKIITTVRTAATTLLAVETLMCGSERTLVIVGSGTIGIEHAKQALAMDIFERITLVSPSVVDKNNPSHSSRLAEIAQLGEKVETGTSIEGSVRSADVVMLCTDSAYPVVENDWLKEVKIVTSLSTNAPGAHEVDPSFLEIADVFCDYRKTCPKVAGEMLLAASSKKWTVDEILADLPELLSKSFTLESGGRRPKYFRSMGLGIEDIAAACSLISDSRV